MVSGTTLACLQCREFASQRPALNIKHKKPSCSLFKRPFGVLACFSAAKPKVSKDLTKLRKGRAKKVYYLHKSYVVIFLKRKFLTYFRILHAILPNNLRYLFFNLLYTFPYNLKYFCKYLTSNFAFYAPLQISYGSA